MDDTGRVGFFGKVPSHGDFVGRRLPAAFVGPWDGWLQAGLADSRARLGAAWLPMYLSSPIWRFALGAGVCGASAWAGVMMPSVDRVGRYFPLTICASIDDDPASARFGWAAADACWYERLETLALSALGPGFSLAAFDAALAAMTPAGAGQTPSGQLTAASISMPAHLAGGDVRRAPRTASPAPLQVRFSSGAGAGQAARLLRSRGLPDLESFSDMVDNGAGAARARDGVAVIVNQRDTNDE